MIRKMKKMRKMKMRFVLGASWQRGRVLWAAPWEQPSPPLKTIVVMKIMLLVMMVVVVVLVVVVM